MGSDDKSAGPLPYSSNLNLLTTVQQSTLDILRVRILILLNALHSYNVHRISFTRMPLLYTSRAAHTADRCVWLGAPSAIHQVSWPSYQYTGYIYRLVRSNIAGWFLVPYFS